MRTEEATGVRVWCVRDADAATIYAYGFGTYLGDHLPPGQPDGALLALCAASIRLFDAEPALIDPAVYYGQQVVAGLMSRAEADAQVARARAAEQAQQARPIATRARQLAERVARSPKIRLDGGAVVWGCQCWWTAAVDDTPARYADGRRIVMVAPPGGQVAG